MRELGGDTREDNPLATELAGEDIKEDTGDTIDFGLLGFDGDRDFAGLLTRDDTGLNNDETPDLALDDDDFFDDPLEEYKYFSGDILGLYELASGIP